ncbi:MAG: heavy metal translocating P-type ATPase, partial [Caulobacterales bacterium]|nr:heavy metal translocating P-type ATPase [Caulobacterales bacterium]
MDAIARSSSGAGCPSGMEPASAGEAAVADPSAFVREAADGARLELLVRGARCGGCIAKIEGGLAALDGLRSARLNLSTGKLSVRFDPTRLPPRAVTEELARLGYHAAPFDPATALKSEDAVGRRLLRCMAVAGFAAANVMLLSVSVWAGSKGEMDPVTRDLFHWLSALIALPAAAYAGRPFFESAVAALRAGRANMDVPISLAVLLALGMSVAETWRGAEEAYFDAAVMLLFFLLIGRWLDHMLRGRARAAARDLLALQATTASR